MNIEYGPSVCTEGGDSTVPATQAATKNGPLEQGSLALLMAACTEHSSKGRGYSTHEMAGQKLAEGVMYTCYRMCTRRLRLLVLQCKVDE